MVDLHLFLGRPLKEAQKDSQAQDDGLLGSVPQLLIDAEQNFLKTAHDQSHDLVSLIYLVKSTDVLYPLVSITEERTSTSCMYSGTSPYGHLSITDSSIAP